MRVLILGGTKFIGAATARALVARGHEVTCFHRGRTHGALPDGLRCVHGERAALGQHEDALRRLAPDVLLDFLPLTRADGRQAVGLARALGARRLVAVSSCDVYRAFGVLLGREPGEPEPAPASEDSPVRSVHYLYRGATPRAADDPDRWQDDYEKLEVEDEVRAAGDLEPVVVRLPMVYGPADPRRRTAPWVRRMLDGRPAIVLGDRLARWRAPRSYVDDAGRAVALCCEHPAAAGRVYNVAEPDPLDEAGWVAAIGAALGWGGRVVVVPEAELAPPLRQPLRLEQDLAIDARRVRDELGWQEEVSRAEALARTVAREREQPPWPVDAAEYAAEDAALARAGG